MHFPQTNDTGIVRILPLLLVIAAFGVISFLLLASLLPFKGLFNQLFSKPQSHAVEIIPPLCSDSLQAKINAAPVGGVVTLSQNCVYRETITINKSLTLDGGNVAQIRGSDIWTSWNPSGSTWISTQTVPLTNINNNNADKRCATVVCLYPFQVFIDGAKQKLVLAPSVPTTGQFSFDASHHMILGTDPTGKVVEVTTRYWWITGNFQPTDTITVQNFTMKHAGTDGGKGAIDLHTCNNCQPTTGHVIIQNNNVSFSHGMNIATYANTQVLGNDSHDADNFGIGSGDNITTTRTNTLVKNNKIHDNNLDDLYNCGWGCGGLKNGSTHNSTFDGNDIYNNHGVGLWCDVGCTNITYSNNIIHNNTIVGIMFEISDGAKIFGNKVWKNGFGDNANWVFPAGILASSSANTEIFSNIVAWNARGISVVWQSRLDRPVSAGIGSFVHDNTIIQNAQNINYYWANTLLAWGQETGGPIALTTSNNRGANNKYWYDQPESYFSSVNNPQFAWPDANQTYFSLTNFNATPGEEAGSYLTNAEKDTILAQNLIPACPTCAVPSPTPAVTPIPTFIPGTIQAPFNGPHTIPGLIQAEDFDKGGQDVAYHDTDIGNNGGVYRNEDVDIKQTSDGGGGNVVGWLQNGEWLEYTVTVPATGKYDIGARICTAISDGQSRSLSITDSVTGQTLPTFIVPATSTGPNSDWCTFQTVVIPGMTLLNGTHVLKVTNSGADWVDFNWITFSPSGTPLPSPLSGSTITITAAGQASNGAPNMTLALNGVNKQSWLVGGDAQNGVFETFSYTSPTKVTPDEVWVRYTNDAYTIVNGVIQDRNLRVQKINIDGVDYPTIAPSVYAIGGWTAQTKCAPGYKKVEWLLCNGYFRY